MNSQLEPGLQGAVSSTYFGFVEYLIDKFKNPQSPVTLFSGVLAGVSYYFDTLAKENSDDTGSKEKGGDLGYFNKGDMVEEFETAAYKLKVNEYTKEPVKTTYGYHIILKTGEKDKPKLKEVKSNIIETLTKEKLENDKTLEVTTLDDLRKSYGLKFKDAKLKKNYNNYIKDAIKQAEKSDSSSQS